jgi:hypothetical protein
MVNPFDLDGMNLIHRRVKCGKVLSSFFLSEIKDDVPSVLCWIKSCFIHLLEKEWVAEIIGSESQIVRGFNDRIVLRVQIHV